MGAYKFYNPSTEQWEIIKSKSIIKDDGSLEYTPDDIKAIENNIGEVEGDLTSHLAEDMTKAGGEFEGITTAHSNTSYIVRQIRNIILSPNDADVGLMQDGDIWIKYV